MTFFLFVITFMKEVGSWLLALELGLLISLFLFVWLIRKALQPLEYIDTFSSLLNEQEFTARFSYLNQKDLDKLISQFNILLEHLHQERLSNSERQHVFEKLMTESPIGVVLLDWDNEISECNPAAKLLLNNKNKSLNMIKINTLYNFDQIEVNQQQFFSNGEGKRLRIGHYQFRDRGFFRSFYLIEELTNDIIKIQKKSYENLIRIMSHEVNNTIAITNSLLESSLNFKTELSRESGNDFENALNVVIERNGNLNKFMQGYSEVVKLEKPKRTNFDLTQLIGNLAILFFSKTQQNNILLKIDAERNIMINADPHLIEQALINIIKNSIEAIEDVVYKSIEDRPKEIEIRLQSIENIIQLDIIDTGCGISEDIKHQLFTPFFTTKKSGQGVGLMLIDEILTAHGYPYKLANNTGMFESSSESGAFFKIYFIN